MTEGSAGPCVYVRCAGRQDQNVREYSGCETENVARRPKCDLDTEVTAKTLKETKLQGRGIEELSDMPVLAKHQVPMAQKACMRVGIHEDWTNRTEIACLLRSIARCFGPVGQESVRRERVRATGVGEHKSNDATLTGCSRVVVTCVCPLKQKRNPGTGPPAQHTRYTRKGTARSKSKVWRQGVWFRFEVRSRPMEVRPRSGREAEERARKG